MIKQLFVAAMLLAGCSSKSHNGLKVAATPVPHAQMLEFIKPELKAKGVELDIIVTSDYNMPNRALAQKEIDANFFQHLPFLEDQMRQFHYRIEDYGAIEIEPMGIYSKKASSLSELKENGVIALPNDPSNEARALLLLQTQGLITLDDPKNLHATILNIKNNPKRFQFIEIDAAMLPRALGDVDACVINTNYALEAKLDPLTDALALEKGNSPYANILVIRIGDQQRPDLIALKEAMTSEKMREFIETTYKGALIPSF